MATGGRPKTNINATHRRAIEVNPGCELGVNARNGGSGQCKCHGFTYIFRSNSMQQIQGKLRSKYGGLQGLNFKMCNVLFG
jgi:hypothetical protein